MNEQVDNIIANIEHAHTAMLGSDPVFDMRYMAPETCEDCGRHLASILAWGELEDGTGTNPCWDTCYTDDSIEYHVSIESALVLIAEIRRLRSMLERGE